MSRGLSPAALAAVTAETVLACIAVDLAFDSGHVRLCTAPQSIFIEGEEYLGVGILGGISRVEETAEVKAPAVSVTLAGVPRDAISIALNEHYQGRRATIFMVLLNKVSHAVINDPIILLRGKMDQMLVSFGETATVELTITNGLAIWDQAVNRRYTDEEQQRRHPGDKFFRFVSATAEKNIVWPAGGFQQGSSLGAAVGGGGIAAWAGSQG
jgi:hypothetical protein